MARSSNRKRRSGDRLPDFRCRCGRSKLQPCVCRLPCFAHEAIQPAPEPAGQVEIGTVNGEDQGVVENAGIEPVRQDQFDPERSAGRVETFFPSADPRERCRRRSDGWRIEVTTVVDCSRSSAAFRRS